MGVVKYNNAEIKLLARLMRAEAEGEGRHGMLMVGNVCINRVLADCLDFRNISSITKMVYQRPGGFEATTKAYFYQEARDVDIKLAKKCISGKRHDISYSALWFYNPFGASCRAQWFGQWNSGRYKNHCFYSPLENENCY